MDMPSSTSSSMGLFDLPDVPGGNLTYVAAAIAAYYFWKRRKR